MRKSFLARAVTVWVAVSGTLAQTVPSWVNGTWKVVQYRLGDNISVGEDSATRARVGQTLSFGVNKATSSKEVCAAPSYQVKRVSRQDWESEFRTSLKSIGMGGSYVDTVLVKCKGQAWDAFGSSLMKLSDGRLMTQWDGVFFVLERQNR